MAKMVQCIAVHVRGETKETEILRKFLMAAGDFLNPKKEFPGIWECSAPSAIDPLKEPWFLQVTAVENSGAKIRLNQKELIDLPEKLNAGKSAVNSHEFRPV